MKDMKVALGSGVKPDLTHVRTPLMVYCARACEYGNDKYERANYLRETDSLKADYERYRAYLRAALSHIMATLDAMELNQSADPKLTQQAGLRVAAYATDTDATPGAKVGASLLPHVAHAAASLNMAIAQAVGCGLLPGDPGQPWKAAPAEAAAPEPLPHPDCPNCAGAGWVWYDGECKTTIDCGVCQ